MAFEKSILVPLGPDETFALLTEPERLRRWQVVVGRMDVRAGGEFRWTIVPGHTAAGEFVEVEPGKRLVYTWGWEGDETLPPGASTVTITLEPTAGGTTVHLLHEGLTDEQAASHGEGWTHYLERLAAAARSGDAGRDEWAASPDPMDKLNAAEASLAVCLSVLRELDATSGTLSTPCVKFNVDQLSDHLIGSIEALGGAAGATIVPFQVASTEDRIASAAQSTLEAWRKRGLDGTVKLGPGELPAALAVNILSIEFLVHGWDYAQACDVVLDVNEALAAYVLELAREIVVGPRDGDRFALEVPVAPSATSLTRLVGFTGRDPSR